MQSKKLKIVELITSRDIWMGFAMLWIVLYHFNINLHVSLLNVIETSGYGGVDIFLFASGLGCYFSLDKNPDSFQFLGRRFKRLMPTYWIFMIFWCAYRLILGTIDLPAIIGNFFCVQSLLNVEFAFNWYITGIWILYLFSPFFKGLVDSFKSIIPLIVTIVVLLLVSISFWNHNDWIIIATRFPIYFLGMYTAKVSKDKDAGFTKLQVIGMLLLTIMGFMMLLFCRTKYSDLCWSYGLFWYPFLFITPGLCIALYYVFKIVKCKPIHNIFKTIGKNSFEIYLIHLFLTVIYGKFVEEGYMEQNLINSLIFIICIVPCCILLKKLVQFVNKIFLL